MLSPAALLAIPLLTGSAASIILIDRVSTGFAFVSANAALVALIAAAAAVLQDERIEATVAVVLGSFFCGFSIGATAAHHAYAPPLLRWFESAGPREPVMLEGVLREDAAPTPFGASLIIDVTSVEAFPLVERGARSPEPRGPRPDHRQVLLTGGIRISVSGTLLASKLDQWRAGRTIRAPVFLRRPSVYLNPGTPDERRPLARRGVVLVGSVKSAALVEIVRHGTIVSETAASIRAWTRRRVLAHVGAIDLKAAGVTTAVLVGDRSGLASEDEKRLQQAGTYHVIAISGGNIAILAVLAMFACRLLRISMRAAAVLSATTVVCYGLVAAGAASVSRAVTVAVLVLTARALDHRGSSLNAVAMAAIAAVATSPVIVLDAGFILSFGATLGILLGMPKVVSLRERPGGLSVVLHRFRTAAATLFAATVCAEVALAPAGAMLFTRVSFAGLLLNFVAIPMMTVVQIAGLIVVATSNWWDAAARTAAIVVHFAAAGLLRSADLVDLAPWLSVDVRPPAWWLMAAYYLGALGLLVPRMRRTAVVGLASAAGLMLAGPDAAVHDAMPPSRSPLRVVVLDVGQGDATVVSLPGGRTLQIDAGGLAPLSLSPDAFDVTPGFDVGERVVVPALRALGVRRMDGLVITHGDPDHILGARSVLNHVRVSSVWEGVPVPPHPGLQSLALFARSLSMSWRTVQVGDHERFGQVDVRVLHPPPPEWERQRVRNEDSVVVELRIGMVSIILPGDIGKEGERAILPHLEAGRLVILKAPHHGSATSSTKELLEATRPAAVIFSCGRDNRFGHPHPMVVERYNAVGSAIFSTAIDGAVFVETDGATVEVRGWAGKRATFKPSTSSQRDTGCRRLPHVTLPS